MIKRALISVYDKTGIVEFAKGLTELGVEILSTGGTATTLLNAGVSVRQVAKETRFPEIMGGRVKTLHPKIHGGLLADGDIHAAELKKHNIKPIGLLVVNLYPFEQVTAKPDCTFADAIENIDIGGPAMIRAAAKNHERVTVVVRPTDYPWVLRDIRQRGCVSLRERRRLARRAFARTARYDLMIALYLDDLESD